MQRAWWLVPRAPCCEHAIHLLPGPGDPGTSSTAPLAHPTEDSDLSGKQLPPMVSVHQPTEDFQLVLSHHTSTSSACVAEEMMGRHALPQPVPTQVCPTWEQGVSPGERGRKRRDEEERPWRVRGQRAGVSQCPSCPWRPVPGGLAQITRPCQRAPPGTAPTHRGARLCSSDRARNGDTGPCGSVQMVGSACHISSDVLEPAAHL